MKVKKKIIDVKLSHISCAEFASLYKTNKTKKLILIVFNTVKPGQKYREIGNVIQKYAQSKGFSVVLSYCGHGIHRLFHCAPSVPHYARNKAVGIMRPGHCFTIEPMISEGKSCIIDLTNSNWSVAQLTPLAKNNKSCSIAKYLCPILTEILFIKKHWV